ncbi:MAG TPA: thiamine pyrophosphate-dependent enzyme [Symbiobacteriaceae bacterium]|jgi:pyruvate ferredoxin oxidoreductase alpha subunit
MTTLEQRTRTPQVTGFKSGNEMAAVAASHVNYHLMGYYPITPSTEIAELLDEMKAEGEHDIVMVPADGEHGAAGICYGAATGGGRVFNATSANGYLYALEQMPVQAGTRLPAVLNLVTRSVSGPLDIRGDHSDLYFSLNTGWIVLLARDPQAVYDLNVIAVRLGEHPDVRLPVIVAYDGFFTSHQKRRVAYCETREPVQAFIGTTPARLHTLDPRNPVTFGPYMNDPDLINNKYQQHLAMEAARLVLPELLREWGEVTGREYPVLDLYRMEDAEVALFLLNSAAETAKEAADELREQGLKVGVISPNVIRPFPVAEIRAALRGVKAVLVGDRADSFGAGGGNMSLEVRAALQGAFPADPGGSGVSTPVVLSRIYGLGGKEFEPADAREFFAQALEAATGSEAVTPFDYHGVTAGEDGPGLPPGLPPLDRQALAAPLIEVQEDPDGGPLSVKAPPMWALTNRPRRIAPGHGACPGCGIFPSLDQFFKGIAGDVVVLYQTGCAMVVTTGYPYTSHRVTYIHNLFQNGAATLSGLVEMFFERKRRGELPVGDDFTFVMVTGDGGMDIGMGPAIGTALRGHRLIILEYDNEGYMNTGSQLSYSTPFGHMTSTSHVGSQQTGKSFHHKDTVQIMAACNMPYVFTAVQGFAQDLVRKAAKAQWYAQHVGPVYGKVLIACPLNWRAEETMVTEITQAAVNSGFFPLYEIEKGKTRITYNPEAVGKRVPVAEWLKLMGKTRHLVKPEHQETLATIQAEVDRRWERIKAMNDHPLL